MGVVGRSIEFNFHPVVTIAESETSAKIVGVGGIFHSLPVLLKVAYMVVEVVAERDVVAEVTEGIDGRVEGDVTTGVPVTVDVLRT